MGTQVLRPQDVLSSPVASPSFSRRRSCNYGNSYYNPRINHNKPTRKQQPHQQPPVRPDKSDRRRRAVSEPLISKRPSSEDLRASDASRSGLVMEKVTILRRGESLDSKLKNQAGQQAPTKNRVRSAEFRSPVACGRSDVYAGSAFAFSPEPSSLPLPSFSKKAASVDNSATRDLRRLLRLD